MNGIEKITLRIKNDAQLEINEIAAAARAKCAEIAEDYKQQAQSTYWQIVGEGKKEAERSVELRKNAAETESKKRMLFLKQEMVALAFEKAEEKIRNLPEGEYEAFLVSLAVEAAQSGDEKIILCAADREKYGSAVEQKANARLEAAGQKAGLTLSDETRDIGAGLILSGGKIETNCSLKTLIELRRNELSGEVGKLLFE